MSTAARCQRLETETRRFLCALLSQPGGFEGSVPGDKEASANYEAIAHRREHAYRDLELIDGNAAAASLASPVVESDDPVPKVDKAFRVGSRCSFYVSWSGRCETGPTRGAALERRGRRRPRRDQGRGRAAD